MSATRGFALALTLITAVAFGQQGTAPRPAPRPRQSERAVPFAVGETLAYDVAWAGLLTAGTATTTVRDKRTSEGSTAYEIVAEGRPAPLLASLYNFAYSADTLLDASSLLPQRGSVRSEEGRRVRVKTTVFDRRTTSAEYEVRTATVTTARLAIQATTVDALSAFYLLRTIPPREGGRLTLSVTDSGTMYTLTATVDALDTVATGLGQLPAWRVTPRILDAKGDPAVSRRVTVWITNDARRLPARLETELAVGRFDLTLREASTGPSRSQ